MAIKIILLIVAPFLLTYLWSTPTIVPPVESESVQIVQAEKPTLAEIFKGLAPRKGDSGLLLSFDTDSSKDAESYAQFYDFKETEKTKTATNKTIFLTRIGDKIELAAKLDYIASPQRRGFLFLGQARYFEPKPRRRNEYLSEFERPDSTTKLFGFDYTRIWKTDRRSDIGQAAKAVDWALHRFVNKWRIELSK